LFTHAYCNSPICSASRQSLLTGKYPHATGVNLLFTPFPDEKNITIAEHLRDRGYKTGLFGKTHFNNWAWASLYKDGLPDHGFDVMIENGEYREWLKQNPQPEIPENIKTYNRDEISPDDVPTWMNSENLPHPVYNEYSSGTFFARQAADFINQSGEQPFFLWTAFFQPHHPYYYPIEFAGKYNPEEMPLPEGSPEDDRWIPAKFQNLTDDEKRGIIAAYYTSTEYLDKNIGIVLDAIKKNGLEENTLVIYISDNGYLLNEHKRFEKHTMWEEAIRQPMIFKAGELFKAGSKEKALVEYIDVVPTILDILGEEAISEAQGKSFLPVLKNDTEEHREIAFSEYLEDNLAMVTSKKWKYVFTTGSRDLGIGYATGYGPSGIVHRLYDLENDPQESENVAEEHPEIMKQMQEEMLNRFIETHPDAEQCPEGLTLEGKLVWFCEPRDVGTDQSPEDAPVRVFKK
jgi:arylsulfatase A-like enzyme